MSAPPGPPVHRDGPHATGRRPPAGTPAAATPVSEDARKLYASGGLGAAWAAGIGLATLTTLMLVGWVAAPHASFGEDIGDVFRVAVQAWLVGHHVGVEIPGGHLGFLPIGLVVLPGLLLYRAGQWLARSCHLPRLRHAFRAALALAGPYAAIAGTLALVGRTEDVRPDMTQSLIDGFVLAFLAGGLGVLRRLLKDKGIAWRQLSGIMPARPRSLLAGTLSATAVLLAVGALLFLVALATSFGEVVEMTRGLEPGPVGGVLLALLQLLYLPNAVIFGMSYAAGPGFALGTGTAVAPTGVVLGPLPHLPVLAVLPDSGPAPILSLFALIAPFLAGGIGGVLTVRSAPTAVSEAAPLWGVVCGLLTGALCAALALLAGGPLGTQRLAEVGPSPWQVGLVVALEVGVAAAVAAWFANWRHIRVRPEPAEPATEPERTRGTWARRPRSLRIPFPLRWPQKARRRGSHDEDGEDAEGLYGISYEADGPSADRDTAVPASRPGKEGDAGTDR
ncbi:DUF6350 family protein [Marinactinospora thermotolerans]|uniref:cell division protein PerM n=1 Tax=Marinactinospora thermotolerans TaxID=531310 RepID=UPI003D8A7040